MDVYKEQFFSGVEGATRAAAKALTRDIEQELIEATINAPDWYESPKPLVRPRSDQRQGHALCCENGS
jgi:hypothetical protein